MKWFEPDLTPVPWELRAGDNYFIEAAAYPKEFPHKFKHDDLGDCVAYIGNRTGDFGEANAKFIVKAVNNHASLLAALEGMLFDYESQYGGGFCECDDSVGLTCNACRARGAVAKAEAAPCTA